MKKYKYRALNPDIRPKNDGWYGDFDDGCLLAGTTVFEEDGDPEFTGLYDADGNPLYRFPDKVPIGFHTASTYAELFGSQFE